MSLQTFLLSNHLLSAYDVDVTILTFCMAKDSFVKVERIMDNE